MASLATGEGGRKQGRQRRRRQGEHYRRVLRLEPDNLLLRNYMYLHKVERDLAGAEYYGRALLACPGDADLLSLYGPGVCYVLGSYASFLWDAEEDEDEEAAAPVEERLRRPVAPRCRRVDPGGLDISVLDCT